MTQAQPAAGTALIVEDDKRMGLALRAQLEQLGYQVMGPAANAEEALQLYQDQLPDLVLLDIRLDGTDGIELAGQLLRIRRVPMLIVTAYSDPQLIARAADAGVFGYLLKPVSVESLAAQIAVSVKRFAEHMQLLHEKEQLEQTLETRKRVERAKGIFMKRLGLDEDQAHRRLQQESQKRRISISELAGKIIESEELLGG